MFKEYFDINISENIETIIVYLYESGEQQKNSDLSLKWPKKYRLYHKRLSVHCTVFCVLSIFMEKSV